MAVGVPETDVFAAADAVLARGERPTVERVRLELGRGSPARVGALLDQWWDQLAQRLRGETRLPGLPTEVAQAFVAVWQQAILLAQGVAEQGLSEQRAVLDAERLRVAAVEEDARQAAAQARQQVTAAQAAQYMAETRLADLERLLEQQQAQLHEWQERSAVLSEERRVALQEANTLRQALQGVQQQLSQEREATAVYVRGVEDRSHQEVDRAREEGKAIAVQLKATHKQSEQLRQRLDRALEQLSQAQQVAAAETARAATLTQQLAKRARTPRPRAGTTKRAAKPAVTS
ncbi:TPA: DNA-binding protein [Pseudomonas aeruginosa]|uniref:DNA-binding protein n=1 Tax=Pseudomonas citronellolis TaxID=53408 RepID=UPI001A1B1CB6|nr:DNA-binding protein [Pseudomonas citronellolis]MBH3547410.1 DNA-binding protein [Pseudomonas aeruginosa]UUC47437.1 DNA-binding protein [Pseudomonas citronellolis]HBN9703327.1 DNA-binding protein [Pseudomonas aeruginosa]HBN9721875.1 DNA-binding protein [Pseudomonas aeruginosa]HBN9767954.1 DNA-binding protein [Pseudomonas aeruginosa]